MKPEKLTAIATIMVVFSGFLGVMFAGAYYLLSIGMVDFLAQLFIQ